MAGAMPKDYGARVLQLDLSCSVIAAIHFRGRSTAFPFVDVSARSAALPQPLPLDRLATPFRRFQPRAVRIWRLSRDAAPLENAEDDQLVVGGSLRDLQALPGLSGSQADSARAGFGAGMLRGVSGHVPGGPLRPGVPNSKVRRARTAVVSPAARLPGPSFES